MRILDLPPELLPLIVCHLRQEFYFVALVCRALLEAEHGVRGALSPRISPLWTAFVSMKRLMFCLQDPAFAAIFRRSSLRLAVRSAAFRAADPRVIDYATSWESPAWGHPATSHQAVARIAAGGSESMFESMVSADGAVFRPYFETKMHSLAGQCGSRPELDPGVEFLLEPVISGAQSRAFRLIRSRVRALWGERQRKTSVWGMIFGSPSFLCRTMLFELAAGLEDGGEMLSLLTEEMEAFSSLPADTVRVHVAAYVVSRVHRGASGCALRWCASKVPSMKQLVRRTEDDAEAGVELVVGTHIWVTDVFSSHCRFLRARKESAFVFVMREMQEGGWLRSFAQEVIVPALQQSPVQHYAELHARAVFEEAGAAELLWPREPLRLLQRCAIGLVDEALAAPSFSRTRDALIFLRKLASVSTRAGLECMQKLHAKYDGGEPREKLFFFYASPIRGHASELLVNSIRLGLLSQALSIIALYGGRALPGDADLRYTMASHALLSCSPALVLALRGSGLRFERMSHATLVPVVRKLGAARVIELGVNPETVNKAARQRGRVLPCLEDSAIFGPAPRP